MAPLIPHKRARAETTDRDSPFGQATSPIANSRSRSKRPRQSSAQNISDGSLSDGNLSSSSSSSSSSSEEATFVHDGDTLMSNQVQPREEDDAQYQEADDLHATQVVARQMRTNKNRKNTPAENGIIEEIRCVNFMCHEQLTVTLGPLINFIIGHNGSGKSAVLTALTLCLGGKATATNRGQSLKSFIKEGTDYCNLSVKIKNQGTSAFKSDVYGKSIIVERHFTKTGASGFKIKDVNGRVVSTKKQELEDIIDAFALQIDNPMNVLTQDMARQFLSDSTGKEKYKFFMKGTQLETLSVDYQILAETVDSMESNLRSMDEDIQIHKKAYDEAKKKATRARAVESMMGRETQLKHQMAWAAVEGQERKLEDLDAHIKSADVEMEKKRQNAEKASAAYESADGAWSQAEQHVLDYQQTDLQPLEEERNSLKDQFEENKSVLINQKTDERNMKSSIKAKNNNIEKLKTSIEEHRQRQADADGGQHAQTVQMLEEAKEVAGSAKEEWDRHIRELPHLQQQLSEAQRAFETQDEATKRKGSEVRASEASIAKIRRGQKDWKDGYRRALQNLDKLLHEIGRETRFQTSPVGPLGRYVHILKPEWSSILEKQSGPALNAFVVTSRRDQTILSELMRKTNCQAPVYIGSDKEIDTTAHEPEPSLDTWLRVLKFTNTLARNQLIINQGIDQIALIRNRQEAVDFMTGDPARRKNVRMCFAMSDRNQKEGHCLIVKPATGAFSMDPISPWAFDDRMQAETESRLKAEQASLSRLNREYQDLLAESRSRGEQLQQCKSAIHQHKRKESGLRLKHQQASDRVEQLEDELNNVTPVAGEIERLEEELMIAQEARDFETTQFEDLILSIDKMNKAQQSLKRRIDALEERVNDAAAQAAKRETKAKRLREKREDALQQKNESMDELAAAQEERSQLDLMRAEQHEVVQDYIRQAQTVTRDRADVPDGKTFDSLKKEVERLIKDREQCERELGGTQEDLLRVANGKKLALREAQASQQGTLELVHTIKQSLGERNQRWAKFKRHIASRARITFGYLLSERNFRGQLYIDHASKNLEIQVEPDITRDNDQGRQAKTLSGGEKSFSTICLLLALWDAMGSPIRCLDEFDVFMDNVNRDISMRMMIGAARRAVGRQYILITPQAMGNVPLEEDVKIIKMKDPERGQTALRFSN